MVVPAVVEETTGVVALAVPPVACVYQFKLLPLTTKGLVGAFSQYVCVGGTVGAAAVVFTFTIIDERGPSQPADD